MRRVSHYPVPPFGPQKVQVNTVTTSPSVIVDASYLGYRAALNASYRLRDTYENTGFVVDDEVDFGAALDLPILPRNLFAVAQLIVSTSATDFFETNTNNYVEFNYGLKYEHSSGFGATMGGGGSLASGYGNVQMRLFLALNYSPSVNPPDGDSDGVPDSEDLCPNDAEDHDGFEDHDGCPEQDNDRDDILDAQDQCPTDEEDKDGFQDEDGCPEFDNDRDGLSDTSDLCPDESEDFDKFEDADGCPELDNDEDGIPDTGDQCPMEPETKNGFADEDGCPDTPPRVSVQGDQIVLQDPISFASRSSEILEESEVILTEIADLLERHPELKKLEIAVYTDSRLSNRRSLSLSQKRADTIMAKLVELYVQPERMTAKGYGATVPDGSKASPKNQTLIKVLEK